MTTHILTVTDVSPVSDEVLTNQKQEWDTINQSETSILYLVTESVNAEHPLLFWTVDMRGKLVTAMSIS